MKGDRISYQVKAVDYDSKGNASREISWGDREYKIKARAQDRARTLALKHPTLTFHVDQITRRMVGSVSVLGQPGVTR